MDRSKLPYDPEDVFIGMGCSGDPLIFVRNFSIPGFVCDHRILEVMTREKVEALLFEYATEGQRADAVIRGLWHAIFDGITLNSEKEEA